MLQVLAQRAPTHHGAHAAAPLPHVQLQQRAAAAGAQQHHGAAQLELQVEGPEGKQRTRSGARVEVCN